MSDRNLNHVNPLLKERVQELLKRGAVACAPFVPLVTEGLRTLARQKQLYGQGRTVQQLLATGKYTPVQAQLWAKPKMSKVTWTLQSKHLEGRAVDIAFLDSKGVETYNGDYKKLGEIGKALGLIWGGTWNTPDKPHFELPKGFELPPLQRHWAAEQEEWFISKGFVTQKKELDAPLTRGEFYVIEKRIYEEHNK